MMNIGFYAKRAAQNRTGLGNYSRFVIRILSEQFASNSYHLYTPKPHRMPYLGEIPTQKKLSLHFPPSKIRSIWRVWGMTHDIQQDGINIFHGLSNELPLNIGTPQQRETKLGEDRCKYLVTIHDLIFIHTSEEKIDVVYQGCDPVFAQDIESSKQEEVKQKYQLPDQYVLYVGSIEERKNLMLVAKAMAEINQMAKANEEKCNIAKIHVVAVGRRTPYVDEIQAYLKEQSIEHLFHFHHQVPYEDLPSFYKLARSFTYPSRIEGFGIPLLEAITSGIPTIGCTGSCLEEAGGPGGIYVNPDDAQSMAEAIVRTCTDEQLRQDMIKAGKTYALNFTDEKLACDLMNTYEKL